MADETYPLQLGNYPRNLLYWVFKVVHSFCVSHVCFTSDTCATGIINSQLVIDTVV